MHNINNSNTLMVMAFLGYLPTPRLVSLVCSSGTRGYHAFKEMLKCCALGTTSTTAAGGDAEFYLVESEDLLLLQQQTDDEGGVVEQRRHLCRIIGSIERDIDPERDPSYQQLHSDFLNIPNIQVVSMLRL